MNHLTSRSVPSTMLLLMLAAFCTVPVHAADRLDPATIGEASGATPTVAEDGVVRISWSRTDVTVTVDGMTLPPAAGLGSWAAFKAMGDRAMVMGDTVVFQDEVDAAMDAAFARGLDVTALPLLLRLAEGVFHAHRWRR